MKLGFEHLSVRKRTVGYSNEELMDAYITVEDACVETREIYHSLTDSISTMDHLIQIRDVVERIGYTETINHLYGNNNITFTTEGLGDTLKKGWEAIVKWFKELWTKIKNFFKRLFGLTDKTIRAIEDEVKQAKKAFASNSKLNTNITVAESFTSSNIQKLSNEFDQNIASKTTIEELCSMDDGEAFQIKEAATDLATKLRGMLSNERSTKKPLDKTFVDKAVDMANLLQDICKKGERVVDHLRTAPDKLKASAEKADDVQQLKAAQNAIKQAGIILNAIDDCAEQAANCVLYIKITLETFNSNESDDLDSRLRFALNELNVIYARSEIIGFLDQDRHSDSMVALKKADKANQVFKEHGKTLYVPDNGRLERLPKEEWSPDYYFRLKAALLINFSREKLVLAQEVIRYLRSKGERMFQVR